MGDSWHGTCSNWARRTAAFRDAVRDSLQHTGQIMFGKKKSTVGLDIGSSSIKVVEIAHDRSGDRLINFGISEPLSEAIVDGEIMDRQLVHEAITNPLHSPQIRNRALATARSRRPITAQQ